jgi:hypothetical protein
MHFPGCDTERAGHIGHVLIQVNRLHLQLPKPTAVRTVRAPAKSVHGSCTDRVNHDSLYPHFHRWLKPPENAIKQGVALAKARVRRYPCCTLSRSSIRSPIAAEVLTYHTGLAKQDSEAATVATALQAERILKIAKARDIRRCCLQYDHVTDDQPYRAILTRRRNGSAA